VGLSFERIWFLSNTAVFVPCPFANSLYPLILLSFVLSTVFILASKRIR